MISEPADEWTYEKDGSLLCRIHDVQLTSYRLTGQFILVTYWDDYLEARYSHFPNAKWPEPDEASPPTIDSTFCEQCQLLDDAWHEQRR